MKRILLTLLLASGFTQSEYAMEPEDLDEQLITAAVSGNQVEVEQLIGAGADVNNVSQYGSTALWLAIEQGRCHVVGEDYSGCVRLLIGAGANVNQMRNGCPILISALRRSVNPALNDAVAEENHYRMYEDIVKLLIAAGARVNDAQQAYNETALYWAVCNGQNAMADLLIKSGANIHATTSYGCTPLVNAASKNNLPMCELLVERMISIPSCEQKERIYTLLGSLRFNESPEIEVLYNPCVLSSLRKGLLSLIREENTLTAQAEVFDLNDIRGGAIKTHLVQKYFMQ